MTAQPPQANAKALVNPESQKPSTSGNNPLPLEDTPVCASTPWPEAGKMSGNLFELRKDWPIPPTNRTVTATNPKLPVKIKPQEPDQPHPSAPAPKPEQCRWDIIAPFAKMQKKTGMASIKSISSKLTKTLKHRIHNKSILPKPKILRRFRTLSATKTTRYHKIPSPPKHIPSMCQTDMQNRYI